MYMPRGRGEELWERNGTHTGGPASPPHATFVLRDLSKNGPERHVICYTHCHFLLKASGLSPFHKTARGIYIARLVAT